MQRRTFIKLALPAAVTQPVFGKTQGAKALKFGVIADPQYADRPAKGARHYRNSIEKLERAVRELNSHDLDFVVTLGDLIDKDIESFVPVMEQYAKLRVPHHKVYGNHDFDVADAAKARVQAAMQMPERGYYAIEQAGWRLVFLDGTEESTYRYPAADPRTQAAEKQRKKWAGSGSNAALSWNGAVSQSQLEWLESQVSDAKQAEQRVILLNHYPVMPHKDNHRLWNSSELLAKLEAQDHVVAYFHGHNHKGGYLQHDGVHHLNFKGMVETAKDSAFAVVTCFADRIEVEGFESEPDRKLGF